MERKYSYLIIFFIIIILFCLAFLLTLGDFFERVNIVQQKETIGFDFSGQMPEEPQGGVSGAAHIFVHQYPMPSDGFITGVTYLNDREPDGIELPETITLLVLRPVVGGWEIVHHVTLPQDDNIPATTGETIFELPEPVPVQKGYVFAHWLAEKKGPIPINLDATSIDGRSVGKFGFTAADIKIGKIIKNEGFTGNRDYFLNVIFEPAR